MTTSIGTVELRFQNPGSPTIRQQQTAEGTIFFSTERQQCFRSKPNNVQRVRFELDQSLATKASLKLKTEEIETISWITQPYPFVILDILSYYLEVRACVHAILSSSSVLFI